jgi:hypothetical protein
MIVNGRGTRHDGPVGLLLAANADGKSQAGNNDQNDRSCIQ